MDVKELESKLAASEAEKKKLADENAALKKAQATHQADLATAGEVIAELKEKLAVKEALTASNPTVPVGKKSYELVGGAFTFRGKTVDIDVLKDNPKLAEELVKMGFANLRLVE